MLEGDFMENEQINQFIEQYKKTRNFYESLVIEVRHTLSKALTNTTIEIGSLLGRTKEEDSLRGKLKKKENCKNLVEISDLAGVRVVCLYESDLEEVNNIIISLFKVISKENKAENLGIDRMGYRDFQFIVQLGSNFSGPSYDDLRGLNCEIQVRTALQDAWAIISHRLDYKNEPSIPNNLKRNLNNVTSLLEIAQGVFDNVKEKRLQYLEDIAKRKDITKDFLSQPIDYDTLIAYTKWKYPKLPTDNNINNLLLRDLNRKKYKTLADIDDVVNKANSAIEAYRKENPDWFTAGTDFLTKAMGFVDSDFRNSHPFGQKTRIAFEKYLGLVK
jgi:putative GTP pyrophosphokinase